MSKKSFTAGGLNTLIGTDKPEQKKVGVGRPKTQFKKISKSSEEGTKENETRATFIVNEALLDKIKAVNYWQREGLFKNTIENALTAYVNAYEKKHGSIKPRPIDIRTQEQQRAVKLKRLEGSSPRLPEY
jgi:hypothetical protein